jgi:hypothetical protein
MEKSAGQHIADTLEMAVAHYEDETPERLYSLIVWLAKKNRWQLIGDITAMYDYKGSLYVAISEKCRLTNDVIRRGLMKGWAGHGEDPAAVYFRRGTYWYCAADMYRSGYFINNAFFFNIRHTNHEIDPAGGMNVQ